MSVVGGPIVPGRDPLQDPTKKRKATDSQETTQMQKAAFSSPSGFPDKASAVLISHLQTTRTLEKPTWNYKFTENDFIYLVERAGPLLKISVHGDIIPEEVLKHVVVNSKDSLQEVSLECCPQYSADFFFKLSACTQLRVLLAPRNIQLNSDMVAGIASIQTLQKLDLDECIQLRDIDLKCIATGNLQLEELKVRACKNLTDQGLKFLAKGAQRLAALDISWCPLITDQALLALAEHATTLTSLDISSCREVTDLGVRRVLQELELRVLSIGGCVKLTDETLSEIADSARWTIESLDLSYCEKITDVGIEALAEYCKLLKRLDITSCQYISEVAVGYLAIDLPTLETLVIDKIRVDDLASLQQKFPQLKELDVSGLNSTADEFAAARISQALKTLCANTTSLQRLGIAGSVLCKALGKEFFTALRERKIELI